MPDERRAVVRLARDLHRARASDRREGRKIAHTADIAFSTQDDMIVVSIGGTAASGGRTVRLRPTDDPRWSCTCTAEKSPWCKHVVAAVVAVTDR